MTAADTPAPSGERGTRLFSPPRFTINPALLKQTAVLKTADLRLLTADFGDDRVTYEPWLSLQLVERDRIMSWGVYQPSFYDDEPDPNRIDVAWRRTQWDRLRDVDRFRAAPDKSAYLLGDTQIDSTIRFGRLAQLPRLAAAVREGVELLAAGVVVHAASRPDMAWEHLRVSVLADELVMTLEYAPWLTRCGEVEVWAERFTTELDALGEHGTVAPVGPLTVSREPTYDELVDLARRFPEPVVDSWLAGTRS